MRNVSFWLKWHENSVILTKMFVISIKKTHLRISYNKSFFAVYLMKGRQLHICIAELEIIVQQQTFSNHFIHLFKQNEFGQTRYSNFNRCTVRFNMSDQRLMWENKVNYGQTRFSHNLASHKSTLQTTDLLTQEKWVGKSPGSCTLYPEQQMPTHPLKS